MLKREPGTRPRGSWRTAGGLIWTHRYRLALGLSLLFINQLMGLVLPASSKFLIDEVIGSQRGDLLPYMAGVVGVATLTQALTSFALSQVLGVTAHQVIADVRKSVQSHVLRLPVRYFDGTQTGVLISRIMTDAEGIKFLVGSGLVQMVGALLTAAIALGVLFYLNWRLTAVTLFGLLAFAACTTLGFSRLRPIYRESSQLNAEILGRLGQALSGIRVIKAYSAERRERMTFARGTHRQLRNVARTVTGAAAINAVTTAVTGSIIVLMLNVGGRAVLSGEMTLGDLVMYVFFTMLMVSPLFQITGLGAQITEALAGLDRIGEIKRMPTEDIADAGRASLDEVRGEVVFEDVSFDYDAGVPVLRHVSFRAPAGSTTALVGPSGSGKSTLVSLVMALNRPQQGRVTVDGRDLASIRLHDYRRHLGVVLQDNFLFDGTIADNISFAQPRAAREQVEEAGRIAYCDEFVNGFPDGYDTLVGDRGVKLSGGQQQRVAIARAILAGPRILILDEATSNLDSEGEAMIQHGLEALRRGRTTFVIAHRLSTVESADQILVLEKGAIVKCGTHEELLAAGGRYKQLYEKQRRVERDMNIGSAEELLAPVPPDAPGASGDFVRLRETAS